MHRIAFKSLFLITILAPSRLVAQTNDDINAGVQFNFSQPGARALAMGGAFLALADDSSAAFTNPAGLTHLLVVGPQLSAELRDWHYTNVFSDRGHMGGPTTGIGVDTIAGISQGESSTSVEGVSFLSFDYVTHGLILAAYRDQVANFGANIESQGPLVGTGRDLARISPIRSKMSLRIANYGASAAYKFGSLSVGVGLSYYALQLSSLTERFDVARRTGNPSVDRQPGAFFGPADFLGDNIFNTQSQQGDDQNWAGSIGILWKASDVWRGAAVFRKGPSFGIDSTFTWGPRGDGTNGTTDPSEGGHAVLHVPDIYGLGIAFVPPNRNTRVSLDVDRVEYSRLADGLVNILSRAGTNTDFKRSDFQIKDATEAHLGVEYTFVDTPIFIGTARFGDWWDPAHKLMYVGQDPNLRARFLPGSDENHLTFGVGFVIKKNFEADGAFDHSHAVSTLSISLVKFFPD